MDYMNGESEGQRERQRETERDRVSGRLDSLCV